MDKCVIGMQLSTEFLLRAGRNSSGQGTALKAATLEKHARVADRSGMDEPFETSAQVWSCVIMD